MATAIQKQRRQFRWMSWTGALLIAAILFFVNLALGVWPLRLDLSQGRVFSLSDNSKKMVKRIEDRLLVRVIYSHNLPIQYQITRKYLIDLLTEYRRVSGGKIKVEYIDPASVPNGFQLATENGIEPVKLDIRERDRIEVKECYMGVSFQYGERRESIPFLQDTNGLEYEITVRLKKLLEPTRPVLGWLEDGALSLSDPALAALSSAVSQLYEVRPQLSRDLIPDEVKTLWIYGPTRPLPPEWVSQLVAFLARGGTLGIALDPYQINTSRFTAEPMPHGLDALFSQAGIRIKPGLIMDPQCDRIQIRQNQGQFQFVNIVDYPFIPWISDLDRSSPVLKNIDGFSAPFVSPIVIEQKKKDFTYASLARTSAVSFLNDNPSSINPLGSFARPEAASAGPFEIMVSVEGPFFSPALGGSAKKGRLILTTSSRLARSDVPLRPSNIAMMMNLIDWSAQDDALLQIRSKGAPRRPIKPMPPIVQRILQWMMVLFLPLLSIGTGFFLWRRRKVKRSLLPLVYRPLQS